jgi:hypothetical protein
MVRVVHRDWMAEYEAEQAEAEAAAAAADADDPLRCGVRRGIVRLDPACCGLPRSGTGLRPLAAPRDPLKWCGARRGIV